MLLREGIQDVRIADVAAEAGLTGPAVYYYFDGKEHLLRQVIVRDSVRVTRELTAAVRQAPGPVEAIDAFARVFVEQYATQLDAFRLTFLWSQILGTDKADVDEVVDPLMVQLFDALEDRIVEAGGRAGASARRMAVLTWAQVYGLVGMLSLVDSGGGGLLHDTEDLRVELVGIMRRGMLGM